MMQQMLMQMHDLEGRIQMIEYEKLDLEVIRFETEDVIVTSDTPIDGGEGNG